MEPTLDASSAPDGPAPTDLGELILQNGPHKGTARALIAPVMLIGRSGNCDLRLGGTDVQPIHCVLVADEVGWRVRNFAGPDAVKVNGVPITQAPLGDDDVLEIGRFRFLVRTNGPTPAQAAAELVERQMHEKQALRTQAAAVSAQQAALVDQEIQLVQRRTALEQQEEQLAAHLEEKRRRLLELRDNARQAVEALREQRQQHAAQVQTDESTRLAAWREIAHEREAARSQRKHLKQFRVRLKKRWHRAWASERARINQHEADLARQVREVEADRERYQRQQAELTAERLRFNGIVEFGGRQLVDAWATFRQEKLREEARLERAAAKARDRQKALEMREAALAESERDLAERQQHWQQWRSQLEREIEGLENRARNQRRNLFDLEQACAARTTLLASPTSPALPAPSTDAPLPVVIASPTPVAASENTAALVQRLTQVERLAEDLADQRSHLIEQAQRLVRAQVAWQQEREEVAGALEQVGRELHERERSLIERQAQAAALEARLHQRHTEVAHAQRHVEGWQARITGRDAAWQGERDRLLAAIQSREQLAERRLAAVAQLSRRWSDRQQRDREHLLAERAASEKLRQELTALRNEWHQRVTELQKTQRRVTEQALALEQYRQKYLATTDNAAVAARRFERLRSRWSAQSLAGRKQLAEQRQALKREFERLEEYAAHAERLVAERLNEEARFSAEQQEWDQAQLRHQDDMLRLRAELARQKAHRERSEKQMIELQDEVERLARFLLDEDEPPAQLSVAHAA
jgi:hypothetical protein